MREKGQTEAAKTLETPVFSRGIEILTEKYDFFQVSFVFSVLFFPFQPHREKIFCNNSIFAVKLCIFNRFSANYFYLSKLWKMVCVK